MEVPEVGMVQRHEGGRFAFKAFAESFAGALYETRTSRTVAPPGVTRGSSR